MDVYDVEKTLRLRSSFGEVLDLSAPNVGNKVITTPTEIAAALADLCRIKHPTTPQGIEMLCETVLSVYAHP